MIPKGFYQERSHPDSSRAISVHLAQMVCINTYLALSDTDKIFCGFKPLKAKGQIAYHIFRHT